MTLHMKFVFCSKYVCSVVFFIFQDMEVVLEFLLGFDFIGCFISHFSLPLQPPFLPPPFLLTLPSYLILHSSFIFSCLSHPFPFDHFLPTSPFCLTSFFNLTPFFPFTPFSIPLSSCLLPPSPSVFSHHPPSPTSPLTHPNMGRLVVVALA